MAAKKSSKKATVQSKAPNGHKMLTVVEFFVKAVTALTKRNTEVALTTHALPAPPKVRDFRAPANGSADKCPIEVGKSGRRCGGTLVRLDTEKGPSTATEYAMCDKCGATLRVAYTWVHQRYPSLSLSKGESAIPSLVNMFKQYVQAGLIDLPKEIAALPANEQFVAAAKFATEGENAPMQQRAVKGGYMFGVTDVVSHSGKQGRSQASAMSAEQLTALLDF